MLGAAWNQPRDRHLPRRAPSTCVWPGSPPPTPPAGPASTTRRSTTSASRSASCAAWCRVDAAATVTLVVRADRRHAHRRAASRATGSRRSRRQRALPGDHRRRGRRALARDRRRRHPLPGHEAIARNRAPDRTGPDATTQAQRGLEPASSGPGGAGTSQRCPPPSSAVNLVGPEKFENSPPLQSVDAAQAAAPAALRRDRGGSPGARRLHGRGDPGPRRGATAGAGAVGGARAGGPARDRVRRPGDGRAGLRAHRRSRTFLEPYTNGRERGRSAWSAQLRADLDTPDAAPRSRGRRRGRWRPGAARPPTPEIAARDRPGAMPTRPSTASPTGTGKGLFDRVRDAPRRCSAQRLQARGGRGAEQTSTTSAAGSPGCSSPIVARRGRSVRSLAGVAHPPLGHPTHRRPRRRGAPRARRRARLTDPDHRAPRARRRSRSTSTPCAGASASSSWSRSGRARPWSRARRSSSRCGRSSNPIVGRPFPTGGPSPVALRAAEGVVAGDCYDLFVTPATGASRSSSSTSPGTARPRASSRSGARRCSAPRSRRAPRRATRSSPRPSMLGDMGDEVFLTAFVAVIDTDDGRVRYANAGHPPAYVVRDGTTDDARSDRSAGRPADAGLVDRRGRHRPGRQPLRVHRRPDRDPERRATSSSVRSAWSSCCEGPAATGAGGREALHRRGRAVLARRTPRRRHDRRIVSSRVAPIRSYRRKVQCVADLELESRASDDGAIGGRAG